MSSWIIVLSTAFGVSVLSALVPLISIELFLVAVLLGRPEASWWQLVLVISIGQVLGKLLYYAVGRGVIAFPWSRRAHGASTPGRWADRLETFRRTCHRRPVWTTGVLLSSSFVSLPPFAAVSVMAGVARLSLPLFILTGLSGRVGRFTLVALIPGVASAWWF